MYFICYILTEHAGGFSNFCVWHDVWMSFHPLLLCCCVSWTVRHTCSHPLTCGSLVIDGTFAPPFSFFFFFYLQRCRMIIQAENVSSEGCTELACGRRQFREGLLLWLMHTAQSVHSQQTQSRGAGWLDESDMLNRALNLAAAKTNKWSFISSNAAFSLCCGVSMTTCGTMPGE